MKKAFAFIFGALFSLGLMISGMANPEKVINFLDVFGTWDPSLAFVMLGAICIAFIPFQKAVRQSQPETIFHEPIALPSNHQIDSKLITGAVIFGAGWGLAGMCPAPSLTLVGLGHYQALYFIGAMCLGIWLYQLWEKAR